MSGITDEELMARFQQGNADAFQLLFERNRTRVFSFIYRMLSQEREPAEDLMQEVFVKLLRAKNFYEPRAKFSTWLFAIVRNHCINFLRSKRYLQARRTTSLDAEPAEGQESLADRLPAQAAAPTDAAETLERAIAGLPDAYREVFLLRAVEGFSHEETALALGLNPATVRTQYRRARLMLQERLAGQEGRGMTP